MLPKSQTHDAAELTAEDAQLVATLAHWLHQRGWQDVATTLLAIGHPLTFLSSQLLLVAQPTLSWLLPTTKLGQLAHLLEQPTAVTMLIEQLQQPQTSEGVI